MTPKLFFQIGGVVIAFGITVLSTYLLLCYTMNTSGKDLRLLVTIPKIRKTDFNLLTPLLKFFKVDDPMKINWRHVKSFAESHALGEVMLSTDIQSEEDLKEWLSTASSNGRVGLKLNFKNMRLLERCLFYLHDKSTSLQFPVIIHSDIVINPSNNTDSIPLDVFLFKLRTSFSRVPFSIGYTPAAGDDAPVPDDNHLELRTQLQNFKHPAFLSVAAASLRKAWPHIRWLLEESHNLSLLITSHSTGDSSVDASDVLYVCNDWKKDRIYFDLPDGQLRRLRDAAVTAGSPVHFFKVQDALQVTWAHAVNNKKLLADTIKSDMMFLETDVMLDGQGTRGQTLHPIMAHPPAVHSDLSLPDLLDAVANSGKGVKLDFKYFEAVEPALKIVSEKSSAGGVRYPLWLNADILKGPNTNKQGLPAREFLSKINAIFPNVVISIGWTTDWSNGGLNSGYTKAMVEEMHSYAKDLRQIVTFPVRAVLIKPSWPHFQWLLKQSRGYTLTIWTKIGPDADNVTREDMQFLRHNSEAHRVYYDLPDNLMPR